MSKKESSTSFINRLKLDDASVIEELYDKYWRKLYLFSFHFLNETEACDDIVQEIFTDLWFRRHELVVNNFESYLFQAVKFKCIKHLRSKKIKEEYVRRIGQVEFQNQTEDLIYSSELKEVLDRSIQALPVKCQEIFKLSRFENLSNQQIADKLNLSVQTVKNQLSKALAKLRFDVQDVM